MAHRKIGEKKGLKSDYWRENTPRFQYKQDLHEDLENERQNTL